MVITKEMRRLLEGKSEGRCRNLKAKELTYLKRIHKRIDRELNQLLWICIHHPEIFLCELNKNVYGHEMAKNRKFNPSHGKKRLKILLKCVMLLTNCDVQFLKEGLK